MNAQNVVGFCAPGTQLRPNENRPDSMVSSSTSPDGQNEPEDLSLSSTERSTRTRFWSFVDEKKRCGHSLSPSSQKPERQSQNGFWPDAKAVLIFQQALQDASTSSNLSENVPASPQPKIYVHHAITAPCGPDETKVNSMEPKELWNIYPNENQTSSNSIAVQQQPRPAIPLEVLVHWVSGAGAAGPRDFPEANYSNISALPPFLVGTSEEIQQQYAEIVDNPTLTKAAVKSSLQLWKLSLPGESRAKYEQFESDQEQSAAMEGRRTTDRVSSLDPTANQEIRANDNPTVLEERRLIQDVLHSVPTSIQDQLKGI
ncbi:unnamed protein product [Nippostrongylus brasiliensis]|uniref:Protein JASON-like n=1 Tax=Nippostrongylus brasiliensis TaxID=27835 RepID=A0A0N4Y4F7_NIPBR|nr:unnamed protein product [Nippostrongylus brasiliensis]